MANVVRLLHIVEQRVFPEMLGNIDCMHWEWRNCPTTSAGQYNGCSGTLTIILEAVIDCDLWIWHAYFDLQWSNNDINVLESSPLVADVTTWKALEAHYTIQGKDYNIGDYLVDGISKMVNSC